MKNLYQYKGEIMNTKRYEFVKKDVKFLRKNAFSHIFYSILFLSIFILQFMLIIYENEHSKISIAKGVIGVSVMISMIILTMTAILLAGRDINTIMQIKKNNRSVRQVYIFKHTNKFGFLNIYSIINRIIAIITLILSASVITYAVLDYVYNSNIMFFLPLILSVTVNSFSSSGYLKTQLKISETVNEYYDKI